jgi:predicted site-specific integrase-resolvase
MSKILAKWLRPKEQAEHLGITTMTLWRWERDPNLKFPKAKVINGHKYRHVDDLDGFMRDSEEVA